MCVYVRALTPEERTQVQQLVRSRDAVTYRHARVVWLSTQRQRVRQVVAATGLSERWVREVIHRFNQHGLASLPRRKAPGAAPRCDATARAALVALLRRSPTELGIESALWTGATLAAVAKQQGLPALSERTARREIVRAGYRWQQAKRWSKKEPAYERKKASRAPGGASGERPDVGTGV
jgi:transposase